MASKFCLFFISYDISAFVGPKISQATLIPLNLI